MAETNHVCVYNTDPDWIAALHSDNVTTNATLRTKNE